jgi:tetratricopeptide (TPR) repeat protein
MAKETAFTLPAALVLYDFVFFRPAPGGWIKARGAAYGLFLALALPGGMYLWGRIGGAVHDPGVLAPLHYAASQPRIIFEYLRLFLVPVGLCFDYAWPAAAPGEAWPWAVALAGLAAASVWGLWKRHPLGLLGCLFFLLLAPASSFIPIEDLMAEHRMYLPSACLAVAAGAGLMALLERLSAPDGRIRPTLLPVLIAIPALLILALAGLSASRNADYRQGALHMWRDVVAKRPENRRANAMVGIMLVGQGKWEEAAPLLRQAVTGRGWIPKVAYALAGNAYARAMGHLGRERQAFDDFMTLVVRDPGDEVALSNAGAVMVAAGQYPVAIQILTPFLAAKPDSVMLRVNLARAMAGMGRARESLDLLREALTLYDRLGGELAQVLPGKYELLAEAGDALAALGRTGEARESYLKALSARPSPEGEKHIVGQLTKLPPGGDAKP